MAVFTLKRPVGGRSFEYSECLVSSRPRFAKRRFTTAAYAQSRHLVEGTNFLSLKIQASFSQSVSLEFTHLYVEFTVHSGKTLRRSSSLPNLEDESAPG
jgi:hypothetical protein